MTKKGPIERLDTPILQKRSIVNDKSTTRKHVDRETIHRDDSCHEKPTTEQKTNPNKQNLGVSIVVFFCLAWILPILGPIITACLQFVNPTIRKIATILAILEIVFLIICIAIGIYISTPGNLLV